eukprot:7925521-Pyramimonas_sp.AAC.1
MVIKTILSDKEEGKDEEEGGRNTRSSQHVPSPGVDSRPAMWQSVGREYTSNIRWNIRNAVH